MPEPRIRKTIDMPNNMVVKTKINQCIQYSYHISVMSLFVSIFSVSKLELNHPIVKELVLREGCWLVLKFLFIKPITKKSFNKLQFKTYLFLWTIHSHFFTQQFYPEGISSGFLSTFFSNI